MPNVLLVGEDEQLQQIRAALLRTIGAKTACCTGSTAMAVQECRHCELVVLCHSLSEERRSALAESVRTHWPETHVLLVVPTKALERSASDAGVDVVSSMDPYALIRRTVELLGEGKPCVSEDGTS
jgi:DNA-binding response OmpR family regulator